VCQVENIDEMDSKDFFAQKIEQLSLLVTHPLKYFVVIGKKTMNNKKLKLINLKKNKKTKKMKYAKKIKNSLPTNLKKGDIIKIRSKEEILQTLDEENKLNGCLFMDEMWQYCGTQQTVLKKINTFYDEANFRMCKAQNTVVLKDIICSGKIQNFKHDCDRSCLLFWKEEWLEKTQ